MGSEPRGESTGTAGPAGGSAAEPTNLRAADWLAGARDLSELVRTIASSSPDHIFIQDTELRYLLVINPQIGLTQEDMLGRTDHDFLQQDEADRLTALKRQVLTSGRPVSVETSLRSRSGGIEHFDGTYVPRLDSSGKVDGLIGYVRNVTDRRKTEDALRVALADLRQSQEVARIGSYRFDVKADSWTCTETMAEIFGIGPSYEKTTAGWAALVHPQDRESMLRYLAEDVLAKRGRFDREYRIVRPVDGRLVWVHGWGELELGPDGEVVSMFGVIQDVTARRNEAERFELLASATFEGISIIEGGQIVLANEQLASMFGYHLDEFIGRSPFDLIVPEQHEVLRRRFAEGDLSPAEYLGKRKDGSTFPFEVRSRQLEAAGVQVHISALRDLTERKRLEGQIRSERDRANAYLDIAGVMLVALDPDRRVLLANRKALEVLGYRQEELIGKDWFECVMPAEMRDRLGAKFVSLVRGELEPWAYVENPVLTRTGERRLIAWRNTLIRNDAGQVVATLSSGEDITERRQAEEALRESDRRKSEFLAVLSHELRNPLAPIRNSLYILDRAAPGGEQARRAQAIIDRQVEHLTRLVDDLLDVTRITRGKIELKRERFDLNELVERTVEDHRSVFARGDVELELVPAAAQQWVNGDRARLAQAIGNLLDNAAKFTRPGGRTKVSVVGEAARGEVVVRVEDTGRGISPEMLLHVFEAFTQADTSLDRSKGGLGLGLALVKGLVEMHGGRANAASGGLSQGSVFTISLPLAVALPAEPSPRGVVGKAKGHRVLVIEDNVDAAESLREVLELGGHEVAVAYGGFQGLAKARTFRPDIVLCDIGLPEMDGYAVAQAMRADPVLGCATLVALTGYAQPEDVAKARRAGFDAHIAKPPSMAALDNVLAGEDASHHPAE